jgi:transglutaminase-like putative cysteine protease
MTLSIRAELDYQLAEPTDILLQLEAAAIPEQRIISANIAISDCDHFARVPAQDGVGERIWLRAQGRLTVDYAARVAIERVLSDCTGLDRLSPHLLPGETVQYLLPSRYCPSDQFETFVQAEFGRLEGGAQINAMREWIGRTMAYVPGVSTSDTTALESFVKRQGICRDYAHILITFARAAGIPARFASVYALGVEPQDFHAVTEVFLGGEWHLVDATGMAIEAEMAKIGIGRDAADVAFLTAFGSAVMNRQRVQVEHASD